MLRHPPFFASAPPAPPRGMGGSDSGATKGATSTLDTIEVQWLPSRVTNPLTTAEDS